jgi:hypothetical protein
LLISRKIFDAWTKYARRRKLNRNFKNINRENDHQLKVVVFTNWRTVAFAEIGENFSKSKNFYKSVAYSKVFKCLQLNQEKRIIEKFKKAKAYLYLKQRIQKKYFRALKYGTFEAGKRQM